MFNEIAKNVTDWIKDKFQFEYLISKKYLMLSHVLSHLPFKWYLRSSNTKRFDLTRPIINSPIVIDVIDMKITVSSLPVKRDK